MKYTGSTEPINPGRTKVSHKHRCCTERSVSDTESMCESSFGDIDFSYPDLLEPPCHTRRSSSGLVTFNSMLHDSQVLSGGDNIAAVALVEKDCCSDASGDCNLCSGGILKTFSDNVDYLQDKTECLTESLGSNLTQTATLLREQHNSCIIKAVAEARLDCFAKNINTLVGNPCRCFARNLNTITSAILPGNGEKELEYM